MYEYLNENWVKFVRCQCQEGYIDKWRGDASNDPNNEFESKLCVNTIVTYFRPSFDDKWIFFSRGHEMQSALLEFGKMFSAKEIWEYVTEFDTKILNKHLKQNYGKIIRNY